VFECVACGRDEDEQSGAWRCACGGVFDLAGPRPPLDPDVWAGGPATLARYEQALGKGLAALTMGEGFTPLVPLADGVLAKLDFLMPTLSFKDRGAVALMSRAAALGVTHAVEDSSGNAGASIAAYAARADIALDVYVPASTSARKIRQIEWYGARVRTVAGSREDTAGAAAAAADGGAWYASHVFNPWFLEGTQTFAFEIWEQLGRRAPATLVLPAGNGTLVLGAWRGFSRLAAAGLCSSLPAIVAVQAAACAPLAAAFTAGSREPLSLNPQPTAAEGVAVAHPPRGAQVLAAVAESGGRFVSVSEEEIAVAQVELARSGIFVEPTGALARAGARDVKGPAVVALGGAGLKAG
jgi:threonine synthase